MSLFSPVTEQDKVDFAKNLAVMLKSGIAINVALTALGDQARSRQFQSIIYSLRDDIESGVLLSSAFEKREKYFGSVFVSLIQAGEKSGTLQENLYFLADWFEQSTDLRREVSTATMYPKLVFITALLLGTFLAAFILPKLVPMFGQLHVELPLITKMLLAISVFLQKYWAAVFFVGVFAIAGFLYAYRLPQVRSIFHRVYLHIPFVSGMIIQYQLALISQLFATLLRSGLTINDSVGIVSRAATNISYKNALDYTESMLLKGNSLSQAMEHQHSLFPKMVVNIISIGEKSGTLSDSFVHLAEFYGKEVHTKMKKLPTIIEPILLVFIAGVVGFIALAIMLPIYQLTGSVGR